jgi:hypothetical protein
MKLLMSYKRRFNYIYDAIALGLLYMFVLVYRAISYTYVAALLQLHQEGGGHDYTCVSHGTLLCTEPALVFTS